MYYKYFFFDFDGMLCDSYSHTTNAFIKAIYESRNILLNSNDVYDALKDSFETAFKKYEITDKEKENFTKYHENISFKPEATLYLPVKKLLKTITSLNGKAFIFTNRNETLFEYLEKFDIKQYITDCIIKANKPDCTALLKMIDDYKLDKQMCVVVGDRAIDVDAAYNASIAGILYDEDSRVFHHHATHVIKHINELYNFLPLSYTIKNNYHTHTSRCGHAIGSDEEYVIEAIKAGYQTLGFSDHVMIPTLSRNDEYFESISLLKEKYKNQIDIKIALEVEYYPAYLDYYKSLLDSKRVDYFVFGNHGTMLTNEKVGRESQISFIDPFDDDSYLDLYYETLKKAVETKMFKYIAHPDVFLKGYEKWDEKAINLTHKIAKLLKDNDLYAELSGSGYRSRKRVLYNGKELPAYPFYEFFKILKEYDLKFVLGCDAHSPSQLDDDAVKYICSMAKELQLNIVYKIDDFNGGN
ncbi:MAG: HAD hydrolase-like protein [Candidatus Caccosoma sp.]|mgnify:CR=1 FL=1|nr:HAD hydrolase-like protein [Candidatus Caccosoma sp.]